MATKISTFKQVKLVAAFADEDDRTITLDNPVDNLTEQDIRALEPAAAKVIIGDKYGATFTRFKTAYYHNQTNTVITPE